ncbi:roadblock/LC7 domain-containing protein [Micromonospora sonneratiae]|uniref:Roadblock/LC7 domain-containing protein n=1 Tax=Micromonospora sonneratiae TaxID=1184706 RepID=A0ABW3YRV1_9ACTN
MAHSMVTAPDLTQLLDDFVNRVPEVEHALALSPDGLLLAGSQQVDPELATQLSSIVAGLQALALAAGQHYEAGSVRQIVVQMLRAFLFITATRGGAIFVVSFAAGADIGALAYEVALFAGQADGHLPTYLSPASGPVS